jgi:hypothetical protein
VDNDIPHFDQKEHHVRHEKIERTRHRARRRVERTLDDLDYSGGGNSPLAMFFLMSGVLGVILGVGAFVSGGATVKAVPKKKEGE